CRIHRRFARLTASAIEMRALRHLDADSARRGSVTLLCEQHARGVNARDQDESVWMIFRDLKQMFAQAQPFDAIGPDGNQRQVRTRRYLRRAHVRIEELNDLQMGECAPD